MEKEIEERDKALASKEQEINNLKNELAFLKGQILNKKGNANITSTSAPNTLLHKSMVSNELLGHVINLKYQHAMPLYRQQTYFDMMGANLYRQTLSNWVIGAACEFEDVYNIMKEQLTLMFI
ncbi:IS66 family transposase [Clostridium algidicarnis]|uniref:IS66 family transposase n=1 Tax=Clostridium algidicarnis TaxID=37659 RepID=UPI001C0DA802|nr:transposase [Clostridium algidicarnis]MBU3203963.1 IS66 family transposase [Clostridium algidicarnis]MBU3212117.1 IS66 family transposase [Clostridium algidicarnis]MBU3221378.1 IS66 family transposase [Clostridium algidicarnis]